MIASSEQITLIETWRRRILKSRITENIAALFGTQMAAYIFPLATVPYLARVLGPLHWGMVAFAQALGLYLSMIVDFGFQLSATRRIARVRHDDKQVEGIVAGVLGAKGILAVVCIMAVLLLQRFSHAFQQESSILWAGALSGIGQGFSMLWFYQGLERMRHPATADVVGKGIVCLGVFLCVHKPEDAWKVLALQCMCFWAVAVFQMGMVYREGSVPMAGWFAHLGFHARFGGHVLVQEFHQPLHDCKCVDFGCDFDASGGWFLQRRRAVDQRPGGLIHSG